MDANGAGASPAERGEMTANEADEAPAGGALRPGRRLDCLSAESLRYVRETAKLAAFIVLVVCLFVAVVAGVAWAAANYPPALLVAGCARVCGGRQSGEKLADRVYMHALAWPLWAMVLVRRIDRTISTL